MKAGIILWGFFASFLVILPERSAALTVRIGQNFTAATLGVDSIAVPPDGAIAVGLNQVVEMINGRYSVYGKTNGTRLQTMTDTAFWKSAGVSLPSNLEVTDPRIIFDSDSQRWFAAQVDVDPNTTITNRFLLAVSADTDPTHSWHGFAFLADPDNGSFADFPSLGLDANAVYLSANMFDSFGSSLGSTLVAVPKSELLADSPTIAGRTAFGILNDTDFGQIIQPVVSLTNPPGNEMVLALGNIGTDFKLHSTLIAFAIENAGGPAAATLTSPTTISVPTYSVPINPTQPGPNHNLDDGDGRISALVYRVGDILYAVHGTEANNLAAIQWFKVNAVNLALIESGIISDKTNDLYYPSIAANSAGIVVIGCNGSSSASYVSAYAFVGETVKGALTFGQPLLLKAGVATYQNRDSSGTSRWGDYSAISIDPADPNRFWTILSYPTKRSTWSTEITEIITSSELGLTIQKIGRNIQLSWPRNAAGVQLQFLPSFLPAKNWTPVSESPVTINDQSIVVIPESDAQGFFRLIQP